MDKTVAILWLIPGSLGIAGLGVIVAEMMKKWELVSKESSIVWVIIPVLIIFWGRIFTGSNYMKQFSRTSPEAAKQVNRIMNILLIVISFITLASIPFIWFGTIEQLAATAMNK